MQRMMEAVLRRYGTPVQVVHGGISNPAKAFFQPSGSKSQWPKATPLGMTAPGQYLYMGPADQQIDPGDGVIVDGVSYLVKRAECCRDGRLIIYRWAVCVKKGGEDTWTSQV